MTRGVGNDGFPTGGPAVISCPLDRKLCDPVFRRVCLYDVYEQSMHRAYRVKRGRTLALKLDGKGRNERWRGLAGEKRGAAENVALTTIHKLAVQKGGGRGPAIQTQLR